MTTLQGSAGDTINIYEISGTLYFNTNGSGQTLLTTGPFTVTNLTPGSGILKVLFTSDITLSTSTFNFFICNSNNIQFGDVSLTNIGGTFRKPQITINNTPNYTGLIQNGTSTNNTGKNNIYVYNLTVIGSGTTTLLGNAGWIGSIYYANGSTNNYIINCDSRGDIAGSSGGIVGNTVCNNLGTLSIIGCSSTGNIGFASGGILGRLDSPAPTNPGTITINQCYSIGTIESSGAGGIAGRTSVSGANCIISNCYSLGIISGGNAGGIVGLSWKNQVTNCYSKGNITGTGAGGIFGANANASAINCYSTGAIGTGTGGIYGNLFSLSSLAINCYTSGNSSASPLSGIYAGQGIDNFQGSNNFSQANNGNSGVWTNSNANLTLQGVGTIWIDVLDLSNNSYRLLNFGPSPYSLIRINSTINSLIQSYSETISSTGVTSGIISPVSPVFTSVEIVLGGNGTISIDSSTGVISTNGTSPGTYTLAIYAYWDEYEEYTITTFLLTVLSAAIPSNVQGMTIPPCCEPNVCNMDPQISNYDADVIINKKAGKAVDKSVDDFYGGIASKQRTAHSQPIFKSYYDYMNYLQGKYK